MSDDDDQPQPVRNPFVRFKNHVNTRIGAGISVVTGGHPLRLRNETSTSSQSEDPRGFPYDSEHVDSSCANRNMHPFDHARRRRKVIDSLEYWDKWAQLDPYSPYNLRHLPQPIPNDLPRDVDAGHFGFQEAFEDLMAVSGTNKGQLMDLRGRADLKKSILNTFASGEPPLVWVRRLHGSNGRGLLPLPSTWENPPFSEEARERSQQVVEQEYRRPASMREWLDERQRTIESPEELERKYAKDIEALKDLTAKMMKDFGGKGLSWDEMMEDLDKDFVLNPAKMLLKAEQTLRNLERQIESYANELASGNDQTWAPDDAKPAPDDEQEQPSTEQDLFSMIRSAVAGADRSFNNFARSITEMTSPSADWQAGWGRKEEFPSTETVEYDPFGGKTVTTTSEHTDTFGNIHSKIEVMRLNADGEEVGRQTHYSVRSSRDYASQRSAAESNEAQSRLLEQQNKKKLRAAREEEHQAWSELTEELNEKTQDEKTESGNRNGKSSGWFWR
ncbi:hypothetical protein VM1G_00903 [Cytospora mali]|uniref:Uncharacterized protein n=1 Tax=Cytospora mali TaxID=578113 RepID=A0A194VNA3_CYTMA|nr:hypothetical protein VM1G_00903 [Valsa mali]